jgi:hypothetical protein
MASFILLPTVLELLYPPRVDEDDTLRTWASSPRRSAWLTARTFVDMGYNYIHSEANPMYYMHVVAYGRAMIVRFVNPLNGRLLYGRANHYSWEMVTFT